MIAAAENRVQAPAWSAVLPFVAYIVVSAIIVTPILSHLYLPLVDLPNHIARHQLALGVTEALSRYYDYSFKLVPNSSVDLLWVLSGGKGDPVRFSQISIALASAGLVGATMILSRTVWGVWSAWPAAIGIFAYHGSFFWGFQNYLVALPFVLLGIGLWVATEERPIWFRLAIFAPFSFGLFIMHFFAFLGLAVLVFGREMQRLVEAGPAWKKQFLFSAILSLPFVGCIGYLVADVLSSGPSPAGSLTMWGHWLFRLEALASLALPSQHLLSPGLISSAALALTLGFIFLVYLFRSTGIRLEVHQKMRGPIAALCFLALIAPIWLNGVAFVHIRFPILLAAVLFAVSRWRDLKPAPQVGLAVFMLALVALRAVQFNGYAAAHDREVRHFVEVVSELPAGARLLPVRDHERLNDIRLWHVAAYAVTRADVFIPTLFQGVHGLQVREEWRDHSTPSLHAASINWLREVKNPDHFLLQYVVDWQNKYTHAVMIDPNRSVLEPFEEMQEIRRVDRFTLYEITPQ